MKKGNRMNWSKAPLRLCCLGFLLLLASGPWVHAIDYETTVIDVNKYLYSGRSDNKNLQFAFGDLNGDGEMEFVVKDMKGHHDPAGFRTNQATVKLRAFNMQGDLLWTHDMGTGIEEGVWFTPVVCYDVDGDGKDEVYTVGSNGSNGDWPGKVYDADYFIYKLDPMTGQKVDQNDWPPQQDNYSNRSRFQLAIAYLDGVNPSVIAVQGMYRGIHAWAYDKNLDFIWKWSSSQESSKCYRASSHAVLAADVDDDGKDELYMGPTIIDDNGKGMWTAPNCGDGTNASGDMGYAGEIDYDNPGIELWWGAEYSGRSTGLYDASTGAKLWGRNAIPESQGCLADVDPNKKGVEIYSRSGMFDAKGNNISNSYGFGGGRPVAGWFNGTAYQTVEGRDGVPNTRDGTHIAVDITGDWREELIEGNRNSGKITIYRFTGPTQINPPRLRTDRQYRVQAARGHWGSGYIQKALLSKRITELTGGGDFLNASPTSLSFGTSGSSQSMNVSSNVNWTVSDNRSWITLSSTSGSNNGSVSVTVSENTGENSRTGIIIVTDGTITRSINVTQKGTLVEALEWFEDFEGLSNGATSDNGETGWTTSRTTGGTFGVQNGKLVINGWSSAEGVWTSDNIDITTSSPVNLSIDIDDTDNNKEAQDYVKIFYKLNNGSEVLVAERSDDIDAETITATGLDGNTIQIVIRSIVSSDNESYTFDNITISNDATPLPPVDDELSLSTNTVSFSSNTGSTNVNVNSNISWTASSTASWLTVSPSSGTNNGALTLNTAVNGGANSRSAQVVVSGAGLSQTIEVTQSGVSENLAVSKSSLSFGEGAESSSVNVTANIGWTASSSQSWITVSPASGSNNGSINVSVSANNSTSTRIGSIVVSGGAITRTIAVSQDRQTIPGTDFSWTEDFTGLSNGSISDNGTTAWSSSRPDGDFNVQNGAFRVTGWSQTPGVWTSEVIDISSAGSVSLSVDVDDQDNNKEANDYVRIYYRLNGGSEVLVAERNDDISAETITEAGLSGNSIQVIIHMIVSSENESYTIDNVSISNGGVTPPPPADMLEVNPSTLTFGSEAFSGQVSITSNVSWTASSSQSWLSTSTTSGSGNAALILSAMANASQNTRSAVVTITGAGIFRTVNVSQAGAMPPPSGSFTWVEDFSGLSNGAKSDNGATAWTSTRASGDFDVQNGTFRTSGWSSGPGVWSSESIDISTAGAVSISIDIDDEANNKEAADYIKVYYKLNGGSEVLIAERSDDISAETVSASGLSGNTVQVIVRAITSAGNESYIFDNVTVTNGSSQRQSLTTAVSRRTSQLSIYPNPSASGEFTIQGVSGHEFKILSMDGKQLENYSKKLINNDLVKVSGLKSGFYLIQIQMSDQLVSRKLIVQ